MQFLQPRRFLTVVAALAFAAGCSGGDAPDSGALPADSTEASADVSTGEEAEGIRLVTPEAGATIQDGDVIVLDVRTSEEFVAGHLEGAVMIDFYSPDFADQLAELDPTESYLLYCRSGNRSGQTTEIMSDLGFADVAEVEGGISAWSAAGLPVVE